MVRSLHCHSRYVHARPAKRAAIGPHSRCHPSEKAHCDPGHPAAQAASHSSPSGALCRPKLPAQLRQPCSLAEGPQLQYRQQCSLAPTCQSALHPSAQPCCCASPCAPGSASVSKAHLLERLAAQPTVCYTTQVVPEQPLFDMAAPTPARPARSKHHFPKRSSLSVASHSRHHQPECLGTQ